MIVRYLFTFQGDLYAFARWHTNKRRDQSCSRKINRPLEERAKAPLSIVRRFCLVYSPCIAGKSLRHRKQYSSTYTAPSSCYLLQQMWPNGYVRRQYSGFECFAGQRFRRRKGWNLNTMSALILYLDMLCIPHAQTSSSATTFRMRS